MRVRNLIIGMTMALLPVTASAQQGDANARIDAALSAAGSAEIPLSLLESKIEEGRAKGVAEARIASAVEARLEALLRAREALARGEAGIMSAGDLSIAADALQAGVSESAMVDVMTRAPAQRRAVATAVLTELVELGLASDVALARVRGAISQGGEALVNLPAEVSGRGVGRARVRIDAGPPVEIDAGVRGDIDLRGRPDRVDGAANGRADGAANGRLDALTRANN